MLRSSIGARLASLGAAMLLISGLFAQVAPVLGASPSHSAPFVQGAAKASPKLVSRGTINVRQLLAQPAAKGSSDPAATAALAKLEASLRPAGSAPKAKPDVVVPPPPDLATDSGQPVPTIAVAAAGQTEAGVGSVEPADPGIAVGPDESIQANSSSLRFIDRAASAVSSLGTASFFLLPETFGFTTFDAAPRVHFDTLRQRWIATELSWDCYTDYVGNTATYGHGGLNFAISDTPDPLGSWSVAVFPIDDAVPVAPNFGTSTDKLGLATTLFAMGSGGGPDDPGCANGDSTEADLLVMDWAQLGPFFDPSKVAVTEASFIPLVLSLAVQEPVTSPDLRLVTSVDGTGIGGTTSDVFILDLSGSAAKKTVVINEFDLTDDAIVPQFLDAPSPQQPGGSLTGTVATVPDSVIYHDGTLAFTTTYPCIPAGDSTTRDCVRVVTLATTTAAAEPTRLGDTLLGTNGFDDSFGGIAFSGSGVLHAVYTQSSATADASSYETYNLPTDAASAWSAQQLLTAGAGTYGGTEWGAYLGVASDPQDPGAVWVGDPYAAADGTWATTIHEIVVGGGGAGYFPITPIRVLDSRDGTGLTGHIPAVFSSNVPKTFPVAGVTINTITIPSDAVAITGNLTVTGQTAAGFLALTPTPTTTPSSSTLNFPLADIRANNVTIALGPDGSLSAVYKAVAGKHTNVILDVTGYFRTGAGQTYFPIASTRILDSRDGTGQPSHTPAPFVANVAQSFPVQGFGGGLIPITATAITANLTVTGQTKPGFVAVTPAPDNAPGTSTLNFPLHDNRANGLTIPINADGTVSAVYKAVSGTANLILDVTGYYSNAGGGLLFHPLNPGRLVDTRQALGLDGLGNGLHGAQGTTPRQVVVSGHFAVPAGAAAITGNLTITAQTGPGFVAVTDANVPLPTDVDDQLPARRHPGQRDHDDPRLGQPLVRLPADRRQDGPADPRYHRLLPVSRPRPLNRRAAPSPAPLFDVSTPGPAGQGAGTADSRASRSGSPSP